MVDGAVKLQDLPLGKSRFLKLAVHVGGRHEGIEMVAPYPVEQQSEPGVRDGGAVQVGAMPVKPPTKSGVLLEMLRVGGVHETDAEPLVQRIGSPETTVAAKVRKPGIDPHAGARRHHQRLGLAKHLRRLLKPTGKLHLLPP